LEPCTKRRPASAIPCTAGCRAVAVTPEQPSARPAAAGREDALPDAPCRCRCRAGAGPRPGVDPRRRGVDRNTGHRVEQRDNRAAIIADPQRGVPGGEGAPGAGAEATGTPGAVLSRHTNRLDCVARGERAVDDDHLADDDRAQRAVAAGPRPDFGRTSGGRSLSGPGQRVGSLDVGAAALAAPSCGA
jgi:hypothetical protein